MVKIFYLDAAKSLNKFMNIKQIHIFLVGSAAECNNFLEDLKSKENSFKTLNIEKFYRS